MSRPRASPAPRRLPGPGAVPLVVLGAFLGYLSSLPEDAGLFLALGLIVLGFGLRALRSRSLRSIAPVPVLAALVTASLASRLGIVPELVAGGAGLAFLAWLADDPAREPGGIGRARTTIAISGVALGIAWSTALLLPSNSATLGVAAGLLVFAVVALAFLVARPEAFDREAPESA